MGISITELELVWPRQIFTAEAQSILESPPKQEADDAVRLLLEEAFHDGAGGEYLDDNRDRFVGAEDDYDFFSSGPKAPLAERSSGMLLKDVLNQLDSVVDYKPRRFFSARRSAETAGPMGLAETKRDFTRLIGDWYRSGYFTRAFGDDCPDQDHDAIALGQEKLADVTGLHELLWPPLSGEDTLSTAHQGWTEDVFLTLVEALFDEIARPRTFSWHDFYRHRHYLDFSKPTGQELYLWRVNELLERSVLPFRLSSDGPDRGYVVSSSFGPLHELAHQSLVNAPSDDKDEVGHAVKLFRSRTATRQEKRSAVVELAGLLEARRDVIAKAVGSRKDEGALFTIANTFDLRHRGVDQRSDYRDPWLDWIFWWYLSTLSLSYELEADSGP